MRVLILVSMLSLSASAQALDLNQYLDQVIKSNRGLEALRASKDAAEAKRVSGDLSLVPTLNFTAASLSDKKEPNQFGATETKSTDYGLSLNKKFSTGTAVGVSAHTLGMENVGLDPSNAMFGKYAAYGQGSLGVNISQSLWKDAFGEGTRLRQERESAVAQSEVGAYDLQSRQILLGAEAAYWDYVYAQEELKLRQASLERANRIESWLRRRVADGISDRADLLTAQSLVATRRLQLAGAESNVVALRQKLADQLELKPGESLPDISGDLAKVRDPKNLIGATNGKVVQLEAWKASLDAKAAALGAEEAAENTKADLTLTGAYNTNSYENGGTVIDGTKNWAEQGHPTTKVALSWTYMFDTDVKASVTGAARKQALAAKLMSERKALESESAWTELNRQHKELSRQIEIANQTRQIQQERAKAQAQKLAHGRAVTIDVVNSEQDAAEAESSLAKMRAEQRKLEAQTRLYVSVKE